MKKSRSIQAKEVTLNGKAEYEEEEKTENTEPNDAEAVETGPARAVVRPARACPDDARRGSLGGGDGGRRGAP